MRVIPTFFAITPVRMIYNLPIRTEAHEEPFPTGVYQPIYMNIAPLGLSFLP